jgi:molecular chaperone Hsp33
MSPRKTIAQPEKTYNDFIQPFLIDHSAIRGRLVRLGKMLNGIIDAHRYPQAVSAYLAEQMLLAALLSATLSGEGILTLQAKGDGPLKLLVVDVMASGVMRGYAQVDEDRLQQLLKDKENTTSLIDIMGKGYLAVTLDPGDSDKQRYQGIVELKGESLSDAFKGYFVQSQQAEIAAHVFVRAPDERMQTWQAGGIIIERMPLEGGKESEYTQEEQDELWERTQLFMKTLKDEEMLNPSITPQNLLYRLFNEDGVWVYKLQSLKAGCRCSRARVKKVLQTISKEELIASLDDKKLTIHCQFCNKKEVFTETDINRLYVKQASKKKSKPE